VNLPDLFDPDANQAPGSLLDFTQASGPLDQDQTSGPLDPDQAPGSLLASGPLDPDQALDEESFQYVFGKVEDWMDPDRAQDKQRTLLSQYRRSLRLSKQMEKHRELGIKQATKLKHSLETIKRQNIVIRNLEKTIKDILDVKH